MNKLGGGKKLSGYTFIIGKNESVSPPVFKSVPADAVLSLDRPVDHKQGIYFSIYQFKTIRGRIYDEAGIEEVEILVYDKEGRLLLTQTHEVPRG